MQNAEQGNGTIWSRIINQTNARPKDELYKLHGAKVFDTLEVDPVTDPELFEFVEETRTKGPKFSNYSTEKIKTFVSRIYELRKDNSNNTPG